MDQIGQRVRQLRQRAGWSGAELGRRSRINASTISAIELGRLNPYDAQIAKLAGALGVSTAELTGGDIQELPIGRFVAELPAGGVA